MLVHLKRYRERHEKDTLDDLLSRWAECAVPFTADDSRKLGISADWVVNGFVEGVKEKRIALGASSVTDDEVLDMNFF